MDANLLRMVTRDSDIRKLLGANDRVSTDKSQPIVEAVGLGKPHLNLLSGISEILLPVNQKRLQTLDRRLTRALGPI